MGLFGAIGTALGGSKGRNSLSDFMKQITLTFEDLQRTKQSGSVKTIGDLLIKRLTDLKPTERPIHCSDKKRLQFYVKDDDKWEKDEENKKLDSSIRQINNKQHSKLQEWQKNHPNWQTNENETEEYLKMVQKIAWQREEHKKNNDKIKRAISNVTEIKDGVNQIVSN